MQGVIKTLLLKPTTKFLLFVFVIVSSFTVSMGYSQAVKVSSYGLKNHTDAIYKAIESSHDTIILDFISEPWMVKPMKFRNFSNKVILFEEGAELWAKQGFFPNTNDALWSFIDCQNISILGNNATLCMNKEEYVTGEWRNGISLLGSKDITIKDLNIRNTGGDGIYISGGRTLKFSKNISIDNVKSINNKRQGISIISAVDVKISNSLFVDTKGTLPGAGMDIEPNTSSNVIQNIYVENCIFENNYGAGIVVGLGKLTQDSEPISIVFKNCVSRNNHDIANKNVAAELIIGSNAESPVQGSVQFNNLYVENSKWGLLYTRKRSDAFAVQFKNCMLKNIGQEGTYPVLYFEVPNYYKTLGALGGFTFDNLSIDNEIEIDLLLIRGSKLRTLRNFENFKAEVYQRGFSAEPIKYINYSAENNRNVDIDIVKKSYR